MSEICDVFKIIHCKDGVYDLFQDNNWIMSRGCVDSILEHIYEESKFRPIMFEFTDECIEEIGA